MSKCEIEIEYDRADRMYRGGETVSGHVHVTVNKSMKSNGIKLTRFWKTHGYGNTDKGERTEKILDTGSNFAANEKRSYPFSFKADLQPLTYHGHHINIDHYLRVDVDVPWAKDPKHEEDFVLLHGEVPPEITGKRDEVIDFSVDSPSTMNPIVATLLFLVFFAMIVGFLFLALWLVPIVLIIGAVVWVRSKMVASRLGEVKLKTPWLVVGDGEHWPLELEFTPKKSFRINGIQVKIHCQESATSGSGTTSTTRTHCVYEEVHVLKPAGQLVAGEKFHQSLHVALPDTNAYSFDESDNEVTWTAEVRIDIPMFPDWNSHQTLQLLPAAYFVDQVAKIASSGSPVLQAQVLAVPMPQHPSPSDTSTYENSSNTQNTDEPQVELAAGGSSSALLDLVRRINEADRFGSEREQLVAAWADRELDVAFEVDFVSSTMSMSVPKPYQTGRTIRGTLVDASQKIEVLTRNDQGAAGLSRGDRCQRRVRPAKWDSISDRLVLLDVAE